MSPSAKELEGQIGRSLQSGDVLVGDKTKTGIPTPPRGLYQVVGKDATRREHRGLARFLGNNQDKEGVVIVRKLTTVGPGNKNELFWMKSDIWSAIVRKEDRTDNPSRHER